MKKEDFREQSLQKIQRVSKHNKLYKTALLEKKLLYILKCRKARNILLYYPLPFEADVRKVIRKMRKNRGVFLPFMEGESFKMVPFRLPLKRKKFGIFEAGVSLRNIKDIDVAIVPSVGVDGQLKRIGFGKGMYDRFFAKLQKKPYTVFVQHQLSYTDEYVCDEYDVSADIVVTPTATMTKRRFRNKKGMLRC